jgi:hypothetical protein
MLRPDEKGGAWRAMARNARPLLFIELSADPENACPIGRWIVVVECCGRV